MLGAIVLSTAFGWAMAWLLSDSSRPRVILGKAPGGFAEMCVTAKVLQLGVPLVTAFHRDAARRAAAVARRRCSPGARNCAPKKERTIDDELGPDAVPQVFERTAAPRARSSGAHRARGAASRSSISVAARATSPRFSPNAGRARAIIGVDNSKEMLAKARASARRRAARMDRGRHRGWTPSRHRVDVVYSNAALHWQDDHARLFPRIFGWVRAGRRARGADAGSISRRRRTWRLRKSSRRARWRDRLAGRAQAALRSLPAAALFRGCCRRREPGGCVDDRISACACRAADDGVHPVVAWMKGTAMTPFLAALDADERAGLHRRRFGARRRAYPPLAGRAGAVPVPARLPGRVATRIR